MYFSNTPPPSAEDPQLLMYEGLHFFSLGATDVAEVCWEAALRFDEHHLAARCYLRNESVSAHEADVVAGFRAAREAVDTFGPFGTAEAVYDRSVALVHDGRLEEARALLQHGMDVYDTGDDDRLANLALLAQHLLTLRYIAHLGPLNQVVRNASHDAPITLVGLDAEQMHVLALTEAHTNRNGVCTIGTLVTESLYGAFDTLRALVHLMEDGHATIYAPDEDPDTVSFAPFQAADAGDEDDDGPPSGAALLAAAKAFVQPHAGDGTPPPSDSDVASPDEGPARVDDVDVVDDVSMTVTPPASEPPPEGALFSVVPDAEASAAPARRPAPDDSETPAPAGSDFSTRYREAARAYVQGEVAEARRLFEQCIELRPDDPRPGRNLERLNAQSDGS